MAKKQKNFNLKTITVVLLLLLIGIPCITFWALQNNKNSRTDNSSTENTSNNITNILLLGTDGRDKEEAFRSDCMIIATLDMKNKSIKLTSLARDTYVDIPGHGKGKLNEAYF